MASSAAFGGAAVHRHVAQRPLVFASLLFLLGWIGIFAQRGFLRQLVVGAPVFEEFAKLGLALAVVTLLRVRPVWLRLPFGWASGRPSARWSTSSRTATSRRSPRGPHRVPRGGLRLVHGGLVAREPCPTRAPAG